MIHQLKAVCLYIKEILYKLLKPNQSIYIGRTYNDVTITQVVNGKPITITCREYIYSKLVDKWYIGNDTWHLYDVMSCDGETYISRIYPDMGGWFKQQGVYSHHQAIRMHIKYLSQKNRKGKT